MHHTPGPWHLGKPERKGEDAHTCAVMTEYATPSRPDTAPCHDIICETWSPHHMASSVRLTREECIANARLIAAAPDMLAALKVLVNDSMFKDHPVASQMAIDAIAKAES